MTRRERRRAQRIAERRAERDRAHRPSPPIWQNPAILTIAVVAIGVVFVALFILRPGTGGGGSTGDLNPPATSIPAGLEHDRSLGSPGAPVTVDLWTDFQCPFCGQLATNVEPRIITDFVETGQAKLVAHGFSFIGQGRTPDESTDAATAARCADQQGKYWEYAEYLWANQAGENQGAFSKDRLDRIAAAVGLDVTRFDQCFTDQSVRSSVGAETAQGAQAGVTSTPTVFVNGQKLVAPTYEQLATAIRQAQGSASPGALASSSASPSPAASASSSAP
jgi:protein-disulfide isomerase